MRARLQETENSEVIPFLRLITIPFLKHRYDTQFFFHKIEKNFALNWKNFFFGGSVEEAFEKWDEIKFDEKEFSQMRWMSPLNTLKDFYENGMGLAPPQFILLNILSNFRNIEELEKFLRHKEFQGDFPMMLCHRNTEDVDKRMMNEFKYVAVGNCDEAYPIDQVLGREKDEELKMDIKKSFERFAVQGNRMRIFFKDPRKMFEKNYDVDVCIQEKSLLGFLCGYNELTKQYNK